MYNYIRYISSKFSLLFNYIFNRHKKYDDENYDNNMCYDLIFNNVENKNEYFINSVDL